MSFLYDVVIRVLFRCVVSAFRRSRTKTRALLRGLFLNGVAQRNSRVGTTPGDDKGVPENTCIRVLCVVGGEL